MDKKMKIYIGIVVVIIIALVAILGVKIFYKNQTPEVVEPEVSMEENVPEEKEEEIKIFHRKR